MMRLFTKRAQSTAEYAILVGLVIGLVVAMQTHVKRSLQGGTKFAVDKLKSSATTGTGQYEPYYMKSAYQATTNQYEETEETILGGKVVRELGKGESGVQTRTRTGQQKILGTTYAD